MTMRKNAYLALVAAVAFLAAPIAGSAQSANGDGAPGPNTPMHGLPQEGDGPNYTGAPDLAATSSLLAAGGGAENFSIQKALVAIVGQKATDAEVTKLTGQYGAKVVTDWVNAFDVVVRDAAKRAVAAGVKLPAPSLQGTALATQLVKDGSGDGVFWTGTMLDHLVTHGIHVATMDYVDEKYGVLMDGNYHRVTDQAMYDLAQALGVTSVGLAFFH